MYKEITCFFWHLYHALKPEPDISWSLLNETEYDPWALEFYYLLGFQPYNFYPKSGQTCYCLVST